MKKRTTAAFHCALAALAAASATAAAAQDDTAPRRTRIGLGPQLVPSYPGSDKINVRPFVDVSRARGEEPFKFEAPDESFGFSLVRAGGLEVGPALGIEGSRDADDVGAPLPKVGFTVEVGGFVQYQLSEPVRLRAELRKGLGGHRGLIANLSADYVARDGDKWLFSVGPRITLADDRYHRAYFSVAPADAAASGLTAFSAGGGVQAVGVTAGFLRQFTPRWGINSYARYDRLASDPARSPIVRSLGSRNQYSAGLGLTYTFGRGVR
jgi:outer membrane scaffolding protein for murein synthesis (MipA/OmpV family)